MPYSYTIDDHLFCVFAKGDGVLSRSEYLATLRKGYSDSLFHPEMRSLSDLTGVTHNELDSETLRVSAELSRFSPNSRRAIIVSRSLDYGVSRMYESYCMVQNKLSPYIFYSRAEALTYLNEGFPPEKHIT